MIQLDYLLIPKIILGISLILLSFLVFGWLMQFLTITSFSKLFNNTNPIGVFGIVFILTFGTAYLIKIAFEGIKGIIK